MSLLLYGRIDSPADAGTSVRTSDRSAPVDVAAPGVTLVSAPGFQGEAGHLGDTGWAAYSLAALGLRRVASVRVVPGPHSGTDGSVRVYRAQLFDKAPIYLGTGGDARRHRLDITLDVADLGAWAGRVCYVTVASCPAADAGWGFDAVLAAGEPARYTLVENPPSSQPAAPPGTTPG